MKSSSWLVESTKASEMAANVSARPCTSKATFWELSPVSSFQNWYFS